MNDRTAVATPGEDADTVKEPTALSDSDLADGTLAESAKPTGESAVAGESRAGKESAAAEKEPAAQDSTGVENSAVDSAAADKSVPAKESAAGGKSGAAEQSVSSGKSAGAETSAVTEKFPVGGKTESAAGDDGSDSATADEKSSEGTVETVEESRSRWRSLVPRPVTGVLLLLLVVAVVCAAVFGWKLKARNDDEAAGQAAMAAAKDYAVALTSIDSAHIDTDFSTVLNGATGQFKDMYSQSATQLKPLLLQAKSVSKGNVVAASVQSASSDHAVVMLFVDAQITNVTNPDPRVDRNRILMTMDRVGGRWLASKVDLP
ncbi:hypothetical protein K7711_26115 [Nocardia sp. CA2R105]|uniref:hypothetical protein n=1 Tax=Nocardia coffeae TaxID=2873381 RepID=UPI001CA6C6FE|nr:hypothetical protein [Nocardia coffeae]MBY8859972.1 hypothetical protein [Nocardia coffeae]